MPCAVPPKCEATCLTHLNGVPIAQAQPTEKCGKVRSEPQNGYHRILVLHRHGDAVEIGELVRRAVLPALGARAVVAADVDDQRVVPLAQVVDRLDHPADLVVGIGEVGGVDVGLPDEELLLLKVQAVPFRDLPSARASACAFSGMMPSRFWLAKIVSRSLFQPSSNRCMASILSIHSGVGWCGAWVPPGT